MTVTAVACFGFGVVATAAALVGCPTRRLRRRRDERSAPCFRGRRTTIATILVATMVLALCAVAVRAVIISGGEAWCGDVAVESWTGEARSVQCVDQHSIAAAPPWTSRYEAKYGDEALRWHTAVEHGSRAGTHVIAQCSNGDACGAARANDASSGYVFVEGRVDGFNAHLLRVVAMLHIAALLQRRLVLPVLWESRQMDSAAATGTRSGGGGGGGGASAAGPFPFADYFDVSALSTLDDAPPPVAPDEFMCRCSGVLDVLVQAPLESVWGGAAEARWNGRRGRAAGAAQRWARDFMQPLRAAHRCVSGAPSAASAQALLGERTAALLAQRRPDSGGFVHLCVGLSDFDAMASTALFLAGGERMERLLKAQAQQNRRVRSFLHPDALRIFAALRSSRAVLAATNALFASGALPTAPMVALHVRRGDYAQIHGRVRRGSGGVDCAPICTQSDADLVATVRRLRGVLGGAAAPPLHVFVASNERDQLTVVDALQPRCSGGAGHAASSGAFPCIGSGVGSAEQRSVVSLATLRASGGAAAAQLDSLRPGLRSRVEQEICARAAAFVGNALSTWSYVVLAMRDARVFASEPAEADARRPAVAPGHARILLFGHRELEL